MGESLEAAKQHITFSPGLHFPIKKPTWYINYMKENKLHIHQNTIPHLQTNQKNKNFFQTFVNKEIQGHFSKQLAIIISFIHMKEVSLLAPMLLPSLYQELNNSTDHNRNKDPGQNWNTCKIQEFLGELALFGLFFYSKGKIIKFIWVWGIQEMFC